MGAAARWAIITGALAMLALVSGRLGEAGATASTQDRAFLVAAHQSNLAAIAAGQTAQRKASAAGVRALASRLVADHRGLDAELEDVAAQVGVALPNRPDPAAQRQLAQVGTRTGIAFDRAWVASQIAGHQQAVAAGRAQLSAGHYVRVTALAKSAAPVLQRHLSMLEQLSEGGIATGSTAGTAGRSATPSWWARPASRVLTALGLVLVVFAALFPGRAEPGVPAFPRPAPARVPPFLRWLRRRQAAPVPGAVLASAAASRVAAGGRVPAATERAPVAQPGPTRALPAPRYPSTWRHLASAPRAPAQHRW